MTTQQLTRASPDPRCTALHLQLGLQAVWCCTYPLAAGQTQTNNPNRDGCTQLPVDISDYATCVTLPLSKSASGSAHVNILSV